MVIIMEGPDGAGKTTLGTRLAKKLQIPYFKVSSERKNWDENKFVQALEHDQTYIADFLAQTNCSVVIDRAYPSEYVYSQVFRRKTDGELLAVVDKKFSENNAIVVICRRRDYTNVLEDEIIPKDMLKQIDQGYEFFAKWTACDVIEVFVDDSVGTKVDIGTTIQKQVDMIANSINSIRNNKSTSFRTKTKVSLSKADQNQG